MRHWPVLAVLPDQGEGPWHSEGGYSFEKGFVMPASDSYSFSVRKLREFRESRQFRAGSSDSLGDSVFVTLI